MPKNKAESEDKDNKAEVAQSARERELRKLIENAEQEKSGKIPPSGESPHDFIERKMRDTLKK